jgi:hypothetical protein
MVLITPLPELIAEPTGAHSMSFVGSLSGSKAGECAGSGGWPHHALRL